MVWLLMFFADVHTPFSGFPDDHAIYMNFLHYVTSQSIFCEVVDLITWTGNTGLWSYLGVTKMSFLHSTQAMDVLSILWTS